VGIGLHSDGIDEAGTFAGKMLMNALPAEMDRLAYLVDAVCSDTTLDDELSELDAILMADEVSQDYYMDFCKLHAALEIEFQSQSAVQMTFRNVDFTFVATNASVLDSTTVGLRRPRIGGFLAGMSFGLFTPLMSGRFPLRSRPAIDSLASRAIGRNCKTSQCIGIRSASLLPN
jgi:hypothetical protein